MTFLLSALAFAKRLPPWVYYAIAAIIVAGLIYRAGWNARDEKADSEQAQMVAAYEQAQAEALRLAIAAREAQEARYRDLASQSETSHAQDLAAADAATSRYIAANRVRSCPAASATGATPAPASGDDTGVVEGMPTGIVVAETDVRACADLYAYAIGARAWGLSLAE